MKRREPWYAVWKDFSMDGLRAFTKYHFLKISGTESWTALSVYSSPSVSSKVTIKQTLPRYSVLRIWSKFGPCKSHALFRPCPWIKLNFMKQCEQWAAKIEINVLTQTPRIHHLKKSLSVYCADPTLAITVLLSCSKKKKSLKRQWGQRRSVRSCQYFEILIVLTLNSSRNYFRCFYSMQLATWFNSPQVLLPSQALHPRARLWNDVE